jgi:hypothetical protein
VPDPKKSELRKARADIVSSRADVLAKAATLPTGTVSAVMEELSPAVGASNLTKEEKPILQAIAHGGEGYGSEYGSGPGASNADPATTASPRTLGDSASPAASAMTTMRRAFVKQFDTEKAHLRNKIK